MNCPPLFLLSFVNFQADVLPVVQLKVAGDEKSQRRLAPEESQLHLVFRLTQGCLNVVAHRLVLFVLDLRRPDIGEVVHLLVLARYLYPAP